MSDNAGTGAGLLEFLDWAGRTGEMAPATARSWATAVKRVLTVEEEGVDAVDVRALNVDETLDRFQTLNRTNYSEGSMATYKSRFRNAVAAYLAWLNNEPWKSVSRSTSSKRGTASANGAKQKSAQATLTAPELSEVVQAPQHGSTARLVPYSLPLRPNLMVSMSLPVDLNSKDADRISAFIKSLAFTEPPTTSSGRSELTEEGE